jgi:hypothetical protein
VQDLFAAAARRVQLAGFDAVELHSAPRLSGHPVPLPPYQHSDR